jgi:hypothetical protein
MTIVGEPPKGGPPQECAQPKCRELRDRLRDLVEDWNQCGYGSFASALEVALENTGTSPSQEELDAEEQVREQEAL